MRGAHVALLVEDEAQIAAEMRDHLVAIGHRVVEARTMEEALQRVETAPLCYALVDLQIPVGAESLRARPEAGVTLIERLRMRFPSRRGAGREALAIVAVRSAFTLHRLARWYHERVDFQDRLPWLSTYMGHGDLLGTEMYLRATPELLELASRRFSRRFRRKEQS